MDSSICILKKSIPWIAILTTLLVIPSCFVYGVLSPVAITSILLLVSIIMYFFLKQKPAILEEPKKDEIFNQISTHGIEEIEKVVEEEENLDQATQESEPVEQNLKKDTESQGHGVSQSHSTLDGCSESERIEQSTLAASEDPDMEWLCSGKFGQSLECSDGSISDEESLIEIDLPNGHFVGPKEDASKCFMQHKLQELSTDTMFHQPSLMDVLAEINEMIEEENLIEIDLSMGSIKCSRFEIEA